MRWGAGERFFPWRSCGLGGCFVGLALTVPAEAGHGHKRCGYCNLAATDGEFAPMFALSADGGRGMPGAMWVVDVA